jgi:hypothetical protein
MLSTLDMTFKSFFTLTNFTLINFEELVMFVVVIIVNYVRSNRDVN